MVCDTKEVIRILGCAPLTLADWRKSGAPNIKGRPCRYDIDALFRWLTETKRFEYAAKLEPHCTKGGLSKPAKSRPDTAAEKSADSKISGDLLAAAMNTLSADGISSDEYTLIDNRNLIAGLILLEKKNYTTAKSVERAAIASNLKQLSEIFRRIELDCIEYAKKMGTIVDVETLLSYIGSSFAMTRNQVRNVPFAAAQEIADATGGDPVQISAILKNAIDNALRTASEKLTMENLKNEIDRNISR